MRRRSPQLFDDTLTSLQKDRIAHATSPRPLAGPRYWVALSIASVFGANTGDFVAKYLHLGHAGGLLPLAAILAVILVAERRDTTVHQAYYWLAIIVNRTAATNLADFAASTPRSTSSR